MSSSGITASNSGPLIIRTALQPSVTTSTLTNNNTYLLGLYDVPISSYRVLTTSTNGLLAPTDSVEVSSIQVSSIAVSTLFDRDGSTGAAGEVLHTDGSTIYWGPSGAGSGYWTETGVNIWNNNPGNVGVNNPTPQYNLDVGGNANIASTLIVSTISSSNVMNIFVSSFLNMSSFRTNFVASTFWFGSQNPSNIDAFKIELYGSNLDIYRSSVNGISATFLENNGGGQLVLATNNPTVYINGATNGNNFVGINTSTPQAYLEVGGNAIIDSTLNVASGIYVSSNGVRCNNAIYSNSTDGGPYIWSPFGINSTVLYYYYNGSRDVLQLAPPGNSNSIITFQTASGGSVAEEHMRMDNHGSIRIWNNTNPPSSVNAPMLTVEQPVGPYSHLSEFYNHAILLTDVNYSTNMFMGIDTSTIANGSGYIQTVKRGVTDTALVLNPQGGNVGINSYTPAYPLQVNGTTYISSGGLIANWTGWGNVKLLAGDFENSMFIQDGQFTTPGTPPPYNGYLLGVIGNYATASTFFIGRVDNGSAQPTKSIYLSQTGNVGIGTGTPRYTLDINGPAVSRVACSTILSDPGSNGNNWVNYYGLYNYISSGIVSSLTLPTSNVPASGTLLVLRNTGSVNPIVVANTVDTSGNSVLPGKTSSYTYVTGITNVQNGWYGL